MLWWQIPWRHHPLGKDILPVGHWLLLRGNFDRGLPGFFAAYGFRKLAEFLSRLTAHKGPFFELVHLAFITRVRQKTALSHQSNSSPLGSPSLASVAREG